MIAQATALRTALIDEARRVCEREEEALGEGRGVAPWSVGERARRMITAELAAALRMPECTIQTLLAESQMITHQLPRTRAALEVGEISYRHAQKIVDHALTLPAETRVQFEEAVLPVAVAQTVAKTDRRARIIRERMHPTSIHDRRVAAIQNRCVRIEPARDGMAYVTAFLGNAVALEIHERLTDIAHASAGTTKAHPGEGLTVDQARADAFTDLLMNGTTPDGVGRGVRATVAVTVPVLTLLGASEDPGFLHGVGPIDADTARHLAGTATSFTRILTHPHTGAILGVGRDSYAVPADLRRFLTLRDGACRFPGCSQTAKRCDIDHNDDWGDLGETEHDNLAHLCRGHHRLKHQTRWRITHHPHGALEWTSPTGHIYRTEPAETLTP
ncbi:MAG: hypothetical protein RI885_549 [Actinomycetota bacterium]